MQFRSPISVRGISLVELLAILAAIAVLSTVSGIAVNGVYRGTQHQKVEADVQSLNSAIRLYLANGGSLAGVGDPGEVLTRLKTSRSKGERRRHAGAPSGRLIDPRVTAVAVPEGGWKLRAVFNEPSSRFEISPSAAGVEFRLDPSLAEAAPNFEDRGSGAVSYAGTSGWVWDHGATANPGAPAGPSNFQTNPNVADSSPTDPLSPPDPDPAPGPGGGDGDPQPGSPSPPTPPRLPTPAFDQPGGAHPEDKFPLLVKLTNLTQNIPLQINGVNYRILLEFGATDSFGFSSKSQFHVYEGATGQGELLGTFLPR